MVRSIVIFHRQYDIAGEYSQIQISPCSRPAVVRRPAKAQRMVILATRFPMWTILAGLKFTSLRQCRTLWQALLQFHKRSLHFSAIQDGSFLSQRCPVMDRFQIPLARRRAAGILAAVTETSRRSLARATACFGRSGHGEERESRISIDFTVASMLKPLVRSQVGCVGGCR